MRVLTCFISLLLTLPALADPVPVRLVVQPTTTPWTIAGENHFQAFQSRVYLNSPEQSVPLGAFQNVGLGDVGDTLEINIVTDSGSLSALDLPAVTTDNLLRFIEVGTPANIICDCHCFAARLAGLNYPHSYEGGVYQPMGRVLSNFEENFTEIFGEASLNPGDAVLMARSLDDEGRFSTDHSAVYLGEGLYLSKLGHDGGLVVTTFQQIRNAYPSDRFFRYERPTHPENTETEGEDAVTTPTTVSL